MNKKRRIHDGIAGSVIAVGVALGYWGGWGVYNIFLIFLC